MSINCQFYWFKSGNYFQEFIIKYNKYSIIMKFTLKNVDSVQIAFDSLEWQQHKVTPFYKIIIKN